MNLELVKNYITEYGIQFISAVAVLIIGFWVSKKITKFTQVVLSKQKIDPGLSGFVTSLVSVALKVLVVIAALGQLGVETTSFVAILGAAGLAVGLALQGSLSNFAGGALILFFKPFRVGDIIEAQGYTGKVQEIQIFVTKLLTPDNKTVIIPNGDLSNGNIVNYSEEGKIRIDLTVGISYDADIKKAKKVALKTIEKIDGVLEDPGVTVVVTELADSSVNLGIRPWVNIADYWRVYSESLEGIKNAFDKADIGIPYPHQVVHMINKDN